MKRSPLKRVGKDKARETAKYWPLRRKFYNGIFRCQFEDKSGFCLRKATQIHHMKGQHWRIMNDTKFWMALCEQHHAWIHDNAKEARKRGLILR